MIEILTFDEWQQWLRDNMDYIYKMKEKFQRDEYDIPPGIDFAEPGDYSIEGGAYIKFLNMGTRQKPAWNENVFDVYYVSKVKAMKGGKYVGDWEGLTFYSNQIINKKITQSDDLSGNNVDRWNKEWSRRGRFYIGEPIKGGGVASDLGGRFLNWSLMNPWEVKE